MTATNKTNRTRAMPNGVVLYRGPSMLDGSPIVVIATGLNTSSANSKTGDLIQTWILREDVSPTDAIQSGADASICGDCPHRGRIEDGIVRRNVGRSCYVAVFQAPLNVWKTYHRGNYRDYLPGDLAGRTVRLGAYGDPAAVPLQVWQNVLATASGWTGYTHQWRVAGTEGLKRFVMASCDTQDDYTEAKAKGWRTFRVRAASSETLNTREIACPASAEAGQRTDCAACRLCAGISKMAADIAIIIHGAPSKVNAFQASR